MAQSYWFKAGFLILKFTIIMETINHECYVSLEVAKLLKQTGFDWPCNHAVCCDSTHYPNLKEGDVLEYNYLECSELMEGKKPHMLLCPTLDVAQRWLREVKYISVETGIDVHGEWKVLCCKYPINNKWPDDWCLLDDANEANPHYSTYEEAQEAGIQKALEIILEKGE